MDRVSSDDLVNELLNLKLKVWLQEKLWTNLDSDHIINLQINGLHLV